MSGMCTKICIVLTKDQIKEREVDKKMFKKMLVTTRALEPP